MVTYTKHRKKEETDKLRGERDQIRSSILILDLKEEKL